MSAFIVSNRTLSNVITMIVMNEEALQIFINAGIIKNNSLMEIVKLARLLYKMNIEAVNQRYSENTKYKFPKINIVNNLSPEQGLKSTHCFSYQCSEGDIPESNLYKTFMAYENLFDSKIDTNSKAYDLASWD